MSEIPPNDYLKTILLQTSLQLRLLEVDDLPQSLWSVFNTCSWINFTNDDALLNSKRSQDVIIIHPKIKMNEIE